MIKHFSIKVTQEIAGYKLHDDYIVLVGVNRVAIIKDIESKNLNIEVNVLNIDTNKIVKVKLKNIIIRDKYE